MQFTKKTPLKKRPTTLPRREIGQADGRSSVSSTGMVGRDISRPRPIKTASMIDEGRVVSKSSVGPEPRYEVSRSEIDESLRVIDKEVRPIEQKRRRKRLQGKKQHPLRMVKFVIMALIICGLLGGGYVGVKALLAGGSIFKGGIFGYLQKEPLKADSNGWSTTLVFGTSEDNFEGDKQHDGAHLTDSLIVLSVQQSTNRAIMFSVPRDLWVEYGKTCDYGNVTEGKINALYECYSLQGKNEAAGASALRQKISEVTGLDVQYYAHVNYSVVRDAVDAVGGVSVDIQGTGVYADKGILDRNFDWRCNYECYYVKYPNGPTGLIDGEHALALARARGEGIQTYGLSRANYDREVNQQKIIKSLRERALSVGTLTDITKISKLIDAFGGNLRTNFETKEIGTLMDIGSKLSTESIQQISLVDEQEPVTMEGSLSGQSIVRSVSGLKNYTAIRAFIAKNMNAGPEAQEEASIAVYNASGPDGAATKLAEQLQLQGLSVDTIANAQTAKTYKTPYTVYILTEKTPLTADKIKTQLPKAIVEQGEPPFSYNRAASIVIVIGENPSSE